MVAGWPDSSGAMPVIDPLQLLDRCKLCRLCMLLQAGTGVSPTCQLASTSASRSSVCHFLKHRHEPVWLCTRSQRARTLLLRTRERLRSRQRHHIFKVRSDAASCMRTAPADRHCSKSTRGICGFCARLRLQTLRRNSRVRECGQRSAALIHSKFRTFTRNIQRCNCVTATRSRPITSSIVHVLVSFCKARLSQPAQSIGIQALESS